MSPLLNSLRLILLLGLSTMTLNPCHGCWRLNKEYDSQQHSILCSIPSSIPEEIAKLIPKNRTLTREEFARIAETFVDGIWAGFRERVAEEYEKQICDRERCQPTLLEPRFDTRKRTHLQDIKAEHVTSVSLSTGDVNDLISFKTANKTLIAATFMKYNANLTLLELVNGTLLQHKELQLYPGTCIGKTKSFWGPTVISLSTCRLKHLKLPNEATYYTYLLHPANDVLLEMVKKFQDTIKPITASPEFYWMAGLPNVLQVSPVGIAQYSYFEHDDFQAVNTASQQKYAKLPSTSNVESFLIGGNTFVAFAGVHPDEPEPSNKFVHIYTLSHHPERSHQPYWKLLQKLPHCEANDVKHFTLNNLHFLAVACSEDTVSRLFWWFNNQFFLWQTIPAEKASTVIPIEIPSSFEVALAAITYPGGHPIIELYQFDGGYYHSLDFNIPLVRIGSNPTIISIIHNDVAHLIFNGEPVRPNNPRVSLANVRIQPHEPGIVSVVRLAVGPRATPYDGHKSYHDAIVTCLNEVDRMLRQEREHLDHLSMSPNNTIFLDTPRYVPEMLTFQNGFHSGNTTVTGAITVTNSVTVLPTNGFRCPDCDNRINLLRQNLQQIYAQTQDLVLDRGDDQIVTGHKFFKNDVTSDFVRIEHVTTGYVCNRTKDVALINSYMLRKSGDQVIRSPVTFNGDMVIDNIGINGYVNAFDLRKIATIGGYKTFTSSQHFRHFSADKIFLNGTINGMYPHEFVRSDIPQTITGTKTIKGDVIIRNGVIRNERGVFNNVNMLNLADRIVTVDTAQELLGDLTFASDVAIDSHMAVGRLNGRDLVHFDRSVLRVDGEQRLTGPTRFVSDVHVVDDIRRVQLVNDVDLDVNPVTVRTDQVVPGNVFFPVDMMIRGNLDIEQKLNGIDLDREVVTKHGIQVITGHKTFLQPVTVNHNLTLPPNVRINAVDLSQVGLPIGSLSGQLTTDHLWVDVINGRNVHYDLVPALRKSITQRIFAPYLFEAVDFKTDVRVDGLFGGHRMNRDFVTTKGDQDVRVDLVVFEGNVTLGEIAQTTGAMVNGKDLRNLDSLAVKIDKSQHIRGRKTFNTGLKASVIEVDYNKTINNIDVSEDLFLLNEAQFVPGRFEITDGIEVQLQSTTFDGNVHAETVNQTPLSKFFDLVVYVDRLNQTINGVKTFVNDVTIEKRLQVNEINGRNWNDLLAKIVRLSTPQDVYGNLTFVGNLTFRESVKADWVNGVKLAEEVDKLAIAEYGRISMPLTFKNCFNVDGNVYGISHLNDKDVNVFRNILTKSTDQTITEQVVIAGSVDISNLEASMVDGVPFNDIALINVPTTLPAPFVFDDILINRAVVLGRLNDVDLDYLKSRAVDLSKDHVIRGMKRFRNVKAENVAAALVNGINMTSLPDRIFSKTRDQTVFAKYVFEDGIQVANLDLHAPVNDVNLNAIYEGSLFKRGDSQNVTGLKTFNVPVRSAADVHARDISVHLIDGVDLVKESNLAVKLTGNQTIKADVVFTGPVNFASPLTVIGKVNDLNIPNDLLLTKGDQVVKGSTTFTSPLAINNLLLAGPVNDVDIRKLIDTRVTLSTDQHVLKSFTFLNPVVVDGDLQVTGKMNNFNCHEDFVTTHTNQRIEGTKQFNTLEIYRFDVDFINGLHSYILTHLINMTIQRKWIHSHDFVFEKDVELRGRFLEDVKAEEQLKDLKKQASFLIDNSNRRLVDFGQWTKSTEHCLSNVNSSLPRIVNFVSYLNIHEMVQPSFDSTIFQHKNKTYVYMLTRTNSCKNLVVYHCFAPTCQIMRSQIPLPVNHVESITSVSTSDKSITYVLLRNAPVSKYSKVDAQCDSYYIGKTTVLVMRNHQDTPGLLSITNRTVIASDLHVVGHDLLVATIESLEPLKSYSLIVNLYKCEGKECSQTNLLMNQYYDAVPSRIRWFQTSPQVHHLTVVNKLNTTTDDSNAFSVIYNFVNEQPPRIAHHVHVPGATDTARFVVAGQTYVVFSSFDCSQDIHSDSIHVFHIDQRGILTTAQRIPQSAVTMATATYLGETYLFAGHPDKDVFVYRWHGMFKFRLWSKIPALKPKRINPFYSKGILYLFISNEGGRFMVDPIHSSSLLVAAVAQGSSYTNSTYLH